MAREGDFFQRVGANGVQTKETKETQSTGRKINAIDFYSFALLRRGLIEVRSEMK